jgi:polysaccharide pyruvyl transferase WcaK-like protein
MDYNNQILIHDTAVMSGNRGDDIIMDAVLRELRSIFKYNYFINVPTHDYPSIEAKKLFEKIKISFVGGTNLLSGNMDSYNQWKVRSSYINYDHDVILMGVGWWQYQKAINSSTAKKLRKILSKKYIHSVRDEYTLEKLHSIGITNVLNTSCPTLWNQNKKHVLIGQKKNVVFTLTDYHKDPQRDYYMIHELFKRYEKVSFWIQGSRDYAYLKSIANNYIKQIHVIPPSLEAYDIFLQNHYKTTDYIGTRLHAGIYAINKGVNALIISIDNRAREMARDFNLPILKRLEIEDLATMLSSNKEFTIQTPINIISQWKSQFDSETF